MKKQIFLFIFIFFSSFSFSQQKVKSGYITFNSNSSLFFKNLIIAKDSVTFQNDAEKEMSFSIKSIKKIIDNTGTIIYQPTSPKTASDIINKDTTIIKKVVIAEKLQYKSTSKIYLKDELLSTDQIESLLSKNNDALFLYKKGKSNSLLGTILISGGLGLFVGGGLSNLSTARSGRSGSPAILVVGLTTTAIGIPIKISASKNIRKSINTYNGSINKTTFIQKTDINVIANSKGFGLIINF